MQDVTIVGAGPFGLSIAAHLNDKLDYRVFGRPMASWREQMPKGMSLKSEGFATSISDPEATFRLQDYCAWQKEPYADLHLPITISRFIDYGMAFQRRFVPSLEETYVAWITRKNEGFAILLVNGESFVTRNVVVAAGTSHFAYTPGLLQGPRDLISHTSDHSDLGQFRGKTVIVIGAGASAIDTAVLLSDVGADVIVSTRRKTIPFIGPPKPRSTMDKIVAPMTGLGPGLRTWTYVTLPGCYHAMPEKFRLRVTRSHLGPGPAHFMRHRYETARVQTLYEAVPVKVTPGANCVSVTYDIKGTRQRVVRAEHVMTATGYRVDLRLLTFLTDLLPSIQMVENTPILNRHFQSSVNGLYFVGASASNSFGPIQRFVYGTDYTSHTVAGNLVRNCRLSRTANSSSPLVEAPRRSKTPST
jgi:cation diffusion facilitator CzcD-associated flavoprotein CzcO